jgi:bis(5'-nucleosyl)-tetraphosphatase (symmetrical)
MTVYAIGDVQGCHDALTALLDAIAFDRARDRLWFTGDLVNRGPQSLAALRFVKGLGDAAITVLGNHDLHLLAVDTGHGRLKRLDTLEPILSAPDRDELLAWLIQRPLLHHDPRLGYTLVHAGLLPEWDLAQAQALAAEVEMVLRSERAADFFAHMYGNHPDRWDAGLAGWDRLRVILNAFTRLRYCDAEGRMYPDPKGPPGTQPSGLMAWFDVPGRRSAGQRIIFGHWSSLGARLLDGVVSLDSGCVWGQRLTAARLDAGGVDFISVPCTAAASPFDAE